MKQYDVFDRRTVQSSSVAAVAYDPATSTLEIEFTSGAAYHYTDVEAEAFLELLAASSIGRHFVQEIKGRYPYTKMEERKK